MCLVWGGSLGASAGFYDLEGREEGLVGPVLQATNFPRDPLPIGAGLCGAFLFSAVEQRAGFKFSRIKCRENYTVRENSRSALYLYELYVTRKSE